MVELGTHLKDLRRTHDSLKNQYIQERGHAPSDLSDWFGLMNHEVYYYEMTAWCDFIDTIFEGGLTAWIEGALTSIIRRIYESQAYSHYQGACDQGDQVLAKVTDTVNWAKGQIDGAVNDMRNKIDRDIIAPVRDRVNNELLPALDDAQKKIDSVKAQADNAMNEVNKVAGQVTAFQFIINRQTDNINRMSDRINKMSDEMDAKIKDFESRFANASKTLQDFEKRIRALEEKSKGGIELPPFLRG